jgi:hypothetical protein
METFFKKHRHDPKIYHYNDRFFKNNSCRGVSPRSSSPRGDRFEVSTTHESIEKKSEKCDKLYVQYKLSEKELLNYCKMKFKEVIDVIYKIVIAKKWSMEDVKNLNMFMEKYELISKNLRTKHFNECVCVGTMKHDYPMIMFDELLKILNSELSLMFYKEVDIKEYIDIKNNLRENENNKFFYMFELFDLYKKSVIDHSYKFFKNDIVKQRRPVFETKNDINKWLRENHHMLISKKYKIATTWYLRNSGYSKKAFFKDPKFLDEDDINLIEFIYTKINEVQKVF